MGQEDRRDDNNEGRSREPPACWTHRSELDPGRSIMVFQIQTSSLMARMGISMAPKSEKAVFDDRRVADQGRSPRMGADLKGNFHQKQGSMKDMYGIKIPG